MGKRKNCGLFCKNRNHTCLASKYLSITSKILPTQNTQQTQCLFMYKIMITDFKYKADGLSHQKSPLKVESQPLSSKE